jgi:hypothetical protein
LDCIFCQKHLVRSNGVLLIALKDSQNKLKKIMPTPTSLCLSGTGMWFRRYL